MAYQKTKPAASDKLKNSQSDIKGNFELLSDAFKVNHISLETSADSGKHTWVSLPVQIDPTAPTINSTNIALYSKVDATTTRTELYYKQASAGNVFNITGGKRAATGWSYLSQNIIMAWGSSSGSGDVTVTPSQVTFGTIYSAQVTTWLQGTSPGDKLARLKQLNVGNTFDVFCSTLAGVAANTGFQWMAIGVR